MLRGARAAVFSALCVLLAASGHMAMSGDHLPGLALAAAFVAVWAGAVALAGRERGAVAVTAATLVTQAFLHGLFSVRGGAPAAPAPDPMAGSAVHRMAGHVLCESSTADPLSFGEALRVVTDAGLASHVGHVPGGPPPWGDTATAAPHAMPGGTVGMVALHVVAGLLSAVWLRYGERAVFRLLRWAALRVLVPLLRVAFPRCPAPPPRAATGRERRGATPRQPLLARRMGSRAPPAALAVLVTARCHGRVAPA
ncbi:PE-PGRS family protein [Streptomyces sp. PT12]|nr:PE-PGRS family protein [Streptomyces sp. PT12]